ncbi:hypothetical protein AMECASPLE_000535, partial [Ameca splendens]
PSSSTDMARLGLGSDSTPRLSCNVSSEDPNESSIVINEQFDENDPLKGRGADGAGVKRATIYGGYSPRSGRPGFESRTQQHLPNVSPSLYPSFLSASCQKNK